MRLVLKEQQNLGNLAAQVGHQNNTFINVYQHKGDFLALVQRVSVGI